MGGKIMSGLHKEAAKRWGEMDEEAKRPFVERYKTDIEIWKDERAIMKAQLEAMEEGDKRDAKDNPFYNGWTLFNSEVHIPGVTTSNFSKKASQMWNDLKTEEREAYHERARKINEKGQGDILASTIKKIETSRISGRPVNASLQFRSKFLSDGLKEAFKEMKREWLELSDKERDEYVKPYEVETKLFNAQMEEYRAGDNYAKNKRNMKVIMDKVKLIEEEMNKPKRLAARVIDLFMVDKRESLTGKNVGERNKIGSEMWQALTEEEQMEYKAKWSKLKADWKTDVAEWEERNADNPMMTELRGQKEMLETAKQKGSY